MTQDSGKKPVPHHKKHIARLQREQQQSRIILYTFFGILAAVILLLVYGWLDINYLQLNRPVAKVGDAEILTRDFEARVRLQRQSLLNQYGQYKQYEQFFGMDFSAQTQQIEAQLAVPESIGQSVLEQMIDEELIRQEAAKRGITVSEEELNETVQAGFDFFPNGTPTPSVTPTEIEYPDNSPEIFKLVTATLQFTATAESTSTATAQPTVDSTATVEPSATPTQTATATVTLEPTVTPTSGPDRDALPDLHAHHAGRIRKDARGYR
ncbi:MAG: SurA N-terminal domain-containing protein [Chloroflexi bacterium]|nr:SurA N-terminal domain-containing protein [Chloroflexota bacterium]